MSITDPSSLSSLIRSSSNESKKINFSKSQLKIKEIYSQATKEKPPNNLPTELKKLNLKNRVVLRGTPDLLLTSQSTSEITQNQPASLKQALELFENLKKKLEKNKSIESQVALLLTFLEDLPFFSSLLSSIFCKISEIIKAYQEHVKSLDSTRTDNQDLPFEIKNSIFRETPSKVIKYKPLAKSKLFKEPLIKLTPEAPNESSCKNQRISIVKPSLQLQLQSKKKGARCSSMKIPKLSIEFTEKPDFHEEFMQKIDEFSLSWREQALKLKK